MNCKLLQIFQGADLRCGHDGLTILANESGVKLDKLKPNELCIFINSKRDKIKIYAHNNVIASYRSPDGRIAIEAIQYIPASFGGGKIDYNRALKLSLEKLLS